MEGRTHELAEGGAREEGASLHGVAPRHAAHLGQHHGRVHAVHPDLKKTNKQHVCITSIAIIIIVAFFLPPALLLVLWCCCLKAMPAATESRYLLLGERVPAVGFFFCFLHPLFRGGGGEGGVGWLMVSSARVFNQQPLSSRVRAEHLEAKRRKGVRWGGREEGSGGCVCGCLVEGSVQSGI